MTPERYCIVSRSRANLFGYLTAALVPTDGMNLVIDRRTPRHDHATSWPSSVEDRRHAAGVDLELRSRGWALLTRDAKSGRWTCDPHVAAPRRRSRRRRRRARRALLYVGGVVACLGAVAALVGLVALGYGGYRIPFFSGLIEGERTHTATAGQVAPRPIGPASASDLAPALAPVPTRRQHGLPSTGSTPRRTRP